MESTERRINNMKNINPIDECWTCNENINRGDLFLEVAIKVYGKKEETVVVVLDRVCPRCADKRGIASKEAIISCTFKGELTNY